MNNIRREFTKTLFQKRTYIGWAGLFLVPWLITLAFRFSSGGPGGGGRSSADNGQIQADHPATALAIDAHNAALHYNLALTLMACGEAGGAVKASTI